jgi:hypothetical protein
MKGVVVRQNAPAHHVLLDEVIASYLVCGVWQGGFARVRCRRCPEEFLAAYSGRT